VTLDTASSISLVTCVSSSVGEEPNCTTVTEITGASTFGIRVIGSLPKAIMPITIMATARTIGGSGLRIDHAEMLTAIEPIPSFAASVCARLPGQVRGDAFARRLVPEPVSVPQGTAPPNSASAPP
jgi:hypothetical protein